VNEALWKQATAAVDWARRNPAAAVGTMGDAALSSWMQGTAGNGADGLASWLKKAAASKCPAGVLTQPKLLADEISKAQKAERRLSDAVTDQHGIGQSIHGLACMDGAPNPVNPLGFVRNCVPSSLAYDMSRDTGFPWAEQHFNFKKADIPWSQAEVSQVVRELYGDRQIPGLSAARQINQKLGLFNRMTRAEMEKELVEAGPVARGLLMVTWADGSKHMFNVETSGQIGSSWKSITVNYRDAQTWTPGIGNLQTLQSQTGLRTGNQIVEFYRTK
jgi:hypothetical protein